MKQQRQDSKIVSTEQVASWKALLEELDAQLSSYGHTVIVEEGSDSNEYVATFPVVRASRAKPQDE
jgi:hypothetical protein